MREGNELDKEPCSFEGVQNWQFVNKRNYVVGGGKRVTSNKHLNINLDEKEDY